MDPAQGYTKHNLDIIMKRETKQNKTKQNTKKKPKKYFVLFERSVGPLDLLVL
jgi:hypothetical protein